MRVTIVGNGAMATVCGILLASKNIPVTMLGSQAATMELLATTRLNTRYLPGIPIPESIQMTSDPATALSDCQMLLCAIPTQFIRPVFARLSIPAGLAILSVAKGIENQTLLRPTQILGELAGKRPLGALSGPSIAGELARGLPATLLAASEDPQLALQAQQLFATRHVRVYRNSDLLGVELAGAMKNVIAIAAGILDGLKAGNNAKAALLTRGLVEITRLGTAMGAAAETFAGLAGMGDLVTTCVSPEGRNRRFGELIGQGTPPQEVLKLIPGVVEGMPTTQSVLELARRYQVEMPISACLHAVLFEGKNPLVGISDLMARELKPEGCH